MGQAVTRGAQQRMEDGNAGRAVAWEGSNVGKTRRGRWQRGVEYLQVQRKDYSFDCQGMCTLNVLDVFKTYLI